MTVRWNLRPDLTPQKKRRRQPETALQIACHETLARILRPEVLCTAIGHQGVGARHGDLLRKMGVKRGVFDTVLMWIGAGGITRVLWVEFKSPGKGLTDAQQEWARHAHLLGHWTAIVRSQDDLLKVLDYCGVPTRLAT